jgi:hypothetical protein
MTAKAPSGAGLVQGKGEGHHGEDGQEDLGRQESMRASADRRGISRGAWILSGK